MFDRNEVFAINITRYAAGCKCESGDDGTYTPGNYPYNDLLGMLASGFLAFVHGKMQIS